jgi:hypothetical protein
MSAAPLLDAAASPDASASTLAPAIRAAGCQLALCGLGGRMCWYALNVAVDVFSDIFGPSIYPQMLFVYNAAATAGLVLQVLYDARFDALYGIERTFFLRYALGLVALVFIQLIVARVTLRAVLLFLCGVAGVADYYAGGTLTQVAGMYGGTPAVVFIGQSSCGILLLAYTLATGFGDDADQHDATGTNGGSSAVGGATLYFALCSACSALSLAMFCWFWRHDPCARSIVAGAEANRVKPARASSHALDLLSDMLRETTRAELGGSANSSDAGSSLSPSSVGGGASSPNIELVRQRYLMERERLAANAKMKEEIVGKEWVVLQRAARESWMLQLAIMMQWVALLGVQSYFTLIRCASSTDATPATATAAAAAGPAAGSMNQQLVYVNMFALAVGQWLPDWLPAVGKITQARLLAASAAMLSVSLPAVNLYVAGEISLISRLQMCVVMALFYACGAGLWMLDYRFVSTMKTELQPPTIRLLNLSLEIGILLGIAASSLQHGGG